MKSKFCAMTENCHQVVFNACITACSGMVLLYELNLSFSNWEAGPGATDPLHLADRQLVQMMEAGHIPMVILGVSILPFLCTPAGLGVEFAKKITVIIAALDICIATNIFKAMERGCIREGCNLEVYNSHLMNFKIDVTILSSFLLISYHSCASSVDISSNYQHMLRAGSEADSILNHILKNSISGAACLIEMGLQEDNESNHQLYSPLQPPMTLRRQSQLALIQLYKTMEWCATRQIMVDLAKGSYMSIQSPVSIRKLLKSAASAHTEVRFEIIDDTANIVDGFHLLAFDEKMARIALENACSNAVVHGDCRVVRICADYRGECVDITS